MKSGWILLALAACHDNQGADPSDAAGSSDGPAATGLVGTWNRLDDPPPDTGTLQFLTFNADGTIHTNQRDGIWSEPTPGRMHVADSDGTNSIEIDYVIAGSTMAWNAWLPMGSPNGFVGTWTQYTGVQSHVTNQVMTVNADHTLGITVNGGSSSPGTWAIEGSGFSFTWVLGTEHMRPVGAALSQLDYARE